MSLLVGTTAGAFSIGDSTDELIGGTRINHLIRYEQGWWAADGKGRIHRDGAEVARMPEGAAALCVQPTPDTVWIGSDEARLFALERDTITEDEFFSDAPGRESWYTPWGAHADVRSMGLDADHTLYINIHVGGILRYDNTGLVPTVDISADVHQVAAHPTQKGAIFAATAKGLAASHNGHDFDFRSSGLHAPYCRAAEVLDDRVLFSASTGPRTSQGRIYSCSLWADDIEAVSSGLPEWFDDNVNTHCLASSGTEVYLGHGDTVWWSDDSGSTWSVVAAGLPKITCMAT
jgi:hypothetical protein